MSAPARSRTWTTGSGDLCDILFTTGAWLDETGPAAYHPLKWWSMRRN